MTVINPDCWLEVNGTRFADTGADLEAGTPTALAQLQVAWGRATTVDQPEPSTCRFTVRDRSGGTGFLAVLDIGALIDVWASGNVGAGQATNVAVDGGFETVGLDATDRVRVPFGGSSPTVVTDRVHTGAQSIRVLQAAGATSIATMVPPDRWTIGGSPASWDEIPTLLAGQTWTWTIWGWVGRGVTGWARGVAFTGPTDADGTLFGFTREYVGTGAWQEFTLTQVIPPGLDGRWLGVEFMTKWPSVWQDVAGTWADTPGTWADYSTDHWIDDQALMAPPVSTRDVLVFSGRLTDLAAELVDAAGTLAVEATAVDQLADLQNRYVGDTPWPSQIVAARIAAIISASGADVDTRLDTPLDTLIVSRRDVDNQPAGGLLQELAAGVDGVLWSATHATTGPYLWLENVANRAALATLALQGGLVVIVPPSTGQRPPGRTDLDGCDLPDTDTKWVRDVTD